MGYYAYGSGKALLKEGVNKEELFWKLDKIVDNTFCIEYEFDEDKTIEITDSENYCEEEILEFLNELNPYITEGEMEYSGDDDYHWKFVFNKGTMKWDEIDGEVYYSFNEFSDETLIEELERRGYSVTK